MSELMELGNSPIRFMMNLYRSLKSYLYTVIEIPGKYCKGCAESSQQGQGHERVITTFWELNLCWSIYIYAYAVTRIPHPLLHGRIFDQWI